MEKKIAYLACPYSSNNADEELMEKRFQIANEVFLHLTNKGEVVFSPISMAHSAAKLGSLPRDWSFWEKFDRAYIEVAYKLYVIMIEGWEDSTGVQAEISIAKELGIEIEYIDYAELV